MNPAAPWVLLRGLTRDARHWGALPGMLKACFPDAPVRCVDLAGNGSRHAEASATSIAANVDDVARQVADLQAPLRVLAISMGAMVAIEWARRAPAHIDSLVLLNTSLRPFSPWWRRLNPSRVPLLVAALAGADPVRRERLLLAATSNRAMDDALLARWSAWARDTPVSPKNALRQLHAAARYRIDAKPAVPILFLASRRDRLVDADCSRAIAKSWSAPLHEHPDAGHDLPLDAPEWVVARIAEWRP